MNPLSSLGIGSGVLNYEIIDKLRQADEKSLIAPIDRKLQQNLEKQTELVALKTNLSALNSNAKKLADFSSYLERRVISSDESVVKASVSAGVPAQDITIKIDDIARNSVNEVGIKFASRDDNFSRQSSTMRMYINGEFHDIKITSTDTLNDVAQKIIDESKGEINASIMKTGDKSYSLMINSKATGAKNNLYFGSVIESKALPETLNLKAGDLTISFVDSAGNEKIANIADSNTESSQSFSVSSLRDSILEILNADSDLSALISNGDINIDVVDNKLILNDKRGFGINIGGNKAGELFSTLSVSEEHTFTSNISESGLISGTISIGGTSIDLSTITASYHSSEQNAQALVDAINQIEGYQASLSETGAVNINSTTGKVSIKASGEENIDGLKAIGLSAGDFVDWSILYGELGLKQIQRASDASLTYNGVSISRAENNISDIVNGVTLEILSASEKEVNISIGNNNSIISDEVKEFVENYNALILKLEELTRYDEDTKIAGIFNGNSDIRTIKSSLKSALAISRFKDDKYESISNYGLNFNDDGLLVLDESKLTSALVSDLDSVMSFFRGEYNEDGTIAINGVFSAIESELNKLISGENARLNLFEESLNTDDERLKADRKRNLELLDSRYEIMANRFAAYDSQISQANNSFNTLNMMIEQSLADKRKK